jgi:hypothetical protein
MQLAWRQPTSDVTISMKFGHAWNLTWTAVTQMRGEDKISFLAWSFLYSRTIPAELTKETDTSLQITDLETKKSSQDNFFHLRSHVWSAAVSQSLACIDSNTRFNNKVKYSNTTDSPDQIGTIHVHFPSYRISTYITK